MNIFNKKLCLENIYYLAKEKNIKIGDLESNAGVSIGYLSRLNRDDNKATPSIEVLIHIARQLQVTVDALVSYDFTTPTESEQYVMKFVEKLLKDTSVFELIWERIPMSELDDVTCDNNGNLNHPLFELKTKYEQGGGGYPETYNFIQYFSRFRKGEELQIIGDEYTISISGGVVLHLLKLDSHGLDGIPLPDIEYELYLVRGYSVEPLCHSDTRKNNTFNEILPDLYHAASESAGHIKLAASTKATIDAFMKGLSMESKVEDLPF